MIKKGEIKMIKKLLEKGLSKSAIARKLGVCRETVRKYANKPDGYIPVMDKSPIATVVDSYLPHVAQMLQTAKNNNVHIPTTVIYDEIRSMGYEGSLRWLQQVMQKYELRQRVKEEELIRFETKPGVQMQMDWVEFPKQKISAFVATMGYSRASYVEYVDNEKVETLIQCHINAFNYFGGVPKEGLYDNMKTVMIQRNAYGYGKHKLNTVFEDFAKHCGFKIKVCKPYRAKTKGKVERFNHYLRYSFHNALLVKLSMKNLVLNIDNANAEVLKWLSNKANKRIHSTTLQQPYVLLQEEIPLLNKLPQPYKGISVRSINDIVVNKNTIINTKVPVNFIHIETRDLQQYDLLLTNTTIIPLVVSITSNVAGVL